MQPTSTTAFIAGQPTASQGLQTALVHNLCKLSRAAVLGGIATAVVVGILLAREHSIAKIVAWLAVCLAISTGRLYLQSRLVSGALPINSRTLKLLFFGIALHGLVWAAPGTWLMPRTPDYQVVMALILVGISASTLSSLTPVRHAYGVFVGAMMLPIAAMLISIGSTYALSAIGIVAYTAAMAAASWRQTRNYEEAVQLTLDNAALAEKLMREKEIVERANEDLQRQIEQRERTEAELRVAKSDAEAANKAKSQFLANMSHELRTPLNGVLGMADLLAHSLDHAPSTAKSLKQAQTIRIAGARLLYLIDDILDMARIEAGTLRFASEPLSPRRVVNEVADLLGAQVSDKHLKLTLQIDDDVPESIRGDAHRIRQVLTNLMVNAIKFTDHGGIAVRVVRAPPRGRPDDGRVWLTWSVCDTGIGIAPAARAQLFKPFSQVDDSSTRRFGGTGLGLAICKQLVEAMGGGIDVESAPGRGSTFWFELPFETGAVQRVESSAAPTKQSLQGRVLVVEDNIINRELVIEMLELAGCAATVVHNGAEALAALEKSTFDLVLMDWHMPEMDGVEATRRWREREKLDKTMHRLPIVALTASVLPGDRETCLAAGMDDFIGKPFSFEQLTSVVARWLPPQRTQVPRTATA